MVSNRANTNSQSKQAKQSTRKEPKMKGVLQKPKGPVRDSEGKFTSGSGGLEKLKDFNWKRILPVILVVAIVGGFLVYRSFAVTALLAIPGSDFGRSECTGSVLKETEASSKRNASVCQLSTNKQITPIKFGDSKGRISNESQFKSVTDDRLSTTGYYQVCYSIRAIQSTTTASIVLGSYAFGSSPSGGTTLPIANIKDYQTVCDPVAQKVGAVRPFLKVATGTVRVSSISISSIAAPDIPPVVTPPVSSNNCKSFPDASCTGTKAGISRTESGTITTSRDGQVIENLNINGEIFVEHDNVVIRNVRVKSNGGSAITIWKKTNLLIEDCELNGQHKNAEPAIQHHNYTMRRCNVYGYGEGPRTNSNVLLEDNYIHDFADFIKEGAHADCIQGLGGTNVTIRHNTCIIGEGSNKEGGAWYNNAKKWFDGANGAIFFSNGPGSNVLIENNLLGGGNWGVNLDSNYSNVTIRNNSFATFVPEHQKGGYFGPVSGSRGTNWTVSGSLWYDGTNAGKPAN